MTNEVPVPTPLDPSVDKIVRQAKNDVAQHLGVDAAQIELLEVTSVTWPDASLGCPQPGKDYPEGMTPGYRILLKTGGQQYEYHSNSDNYVIYCENPTPPIFPKPLSENKG